jgi:hypothetical protein
MFAWLVLGALMSLAPPSGADVMDTRPAEGPGAEPEAVTSEQQCDQDPKLLRTKSISIAGARVAILHTCGGDQHSMLALRTKRGWFTMWGFELSRSITHHTEDVTLVKWLGESVAAGTFSDGSPAVVYRSIVREEDAHCNLDNCETRATRQVASVMICNLVVDDPSCGQTSYTCPAKGCGPTNLVKGKLSVTTVDGTTVHEREFSVDFDTHASKP